MHTLTLECHSSMEGNSGLERFYHALRRIAVAALVSGVIAAVVIGYLDLWNSPYNSGMNAQPQSASTQALRSLVVQSVAFLATLFDYGACVMGITVARLDRRKHWFDWLIVVTSAAHLLPAILNVWAILSPSSPLSSMFMVNGLNGIVVWVLIGYVFPLIAVLVTLIFARETRQERATVDADLGITRSAI